MGPIVEKLFGPPDRIRGLVLHAAGPWARAVVVPRETRVAVVGVVFIAVAFALSIIAPLLLIALGPIVWGIPHVMSDVRYLVMQPGHHRHRVRAALVIAGIGAAAAGLGVRGGLLCAAGALCTANGTALRKIVGLAAIAIVLGFAWRDPYSADLWFVQLHNAVGVLIWFVWRPREHRLHWVIVAMFVAGVCALLAGFADPFTGVASQWYVPARGFEPQTLVATLGPCGGAAFAARWVLVYAFAQSVHYVIWLRLVPEDARGSQTPRSFAQSYRALCKDVGSWMVILAMGSAVVLAIWATIDLASARENYLRAAFFHGYLELAALALWFGEARRS